MNQYNNIYDENQVHENHGVTYTHLPNGTLITHQPSVEVCTQKDNPGSTPKKDDRYLPNYEKGHVVARTEYGMNKGENITPQAHDLNQGSYKHMEQGEKDAVRSGGNVESEKIAYVSTQSGIPDAYMVNDTITRSDGTQTQVHLSMTNLQNDELEQMENVSAQYIDNSYPNPDDVLRESMSKEEYAELMEETDRDTPSIKDEYSNDWYSYAPMADAPDTHDNSSAGSHESGGHEEGGYGGHDL